MPAVKPASAGSDAGPAEFVRWFRAAAPYIRGHRGSCFVVYLDGAPSGSKTMASAAQDLALLHSLGIGLALLYGTRPRIDELLQARGLRPRYCEGLRVTDEQALECAKQAALAMRMELESLLSMGVPNTPMAGTPIRTGSGNFLHALPMGVLGGVDCHYTGKVRRVDADAIRTQLQGDAVVTIPPLGYSATGEIFNVSAAEAALQVAGALRAQKLIFLVSGGLADAEGQPWRELSVEEGRRMLAGAELPAAAARWLGLGIRACEAGVQRAHVLDQDREGALLAELFSRDGIGAMISAERFDEIRQAGREDLGGILELVLPLAQEGALLPRPRGRLESRLDDFIVLMRDRVVIGCAALRIYDGAEAAAEIECLAVRPEYRGQGRGETLYRALERRAQQANARELFALTTRSAHWFLERGFAAVAPERLPPSRRREYNRGRNSKVLRKRLKNS